MISLGLPPELQAYVLQHGMEEAPLLARLRAETARRDDARMQIAPEQGALMAWLVRALGVSRYLEVGVYTGYSALAVGLALPEHGEAVLIDRDPHATAVAQRYWQQAGLASRMQLRLADAVSALDDLLAEGGAGTFDLAFIDAHKPDYPAYYERCLQLVRMGGVLLVDNVLWYGRVLDASSTDEDTVAIRAFNQQLAKDRRVDRVMLPVGDGLMLCRRVG